MGGIHTSNFKRVHIGLLLDLILLFAVPAILGLLLALIVDQLSAAGMPLETVTVQTLLTNPSLAVRAFYALLVFQYCAVALCMLLVVSGLGELETDVPELLCAKRLFLALMLTEAAAMLTHITGLLLPNDDSFPAAVIASVVFLVSLLLLLILRASALRRLMLGYAKILERVGADAAAKRAGRLSRRIVLSAALLLSFLFGSVVVRLVGFSSGKEFFLILTAAALVFHAVVRVQLVSFTHQTTGVIAAISR